MKTEDLKEKGLTDEQIQFVMAENGKDIKKLQKENGTLESDRDNWKQRAETAEETLKKFDGVDLETMQTELNNWKQKAETAAKDYEQKIYERDFSDALKTELESVKFSSDAAKRAVMAEIKESGLKLKDGKILGLSDLIGQIKERDASAFVDEKQEQAKKNMAKFTTSFKPSGNNGTYTKQDFLKMSLDERIKLKNTDPDLYKQLRE